MDRLTRAFWKWLPIGLAVTMLCGISYILVQQVYRQDANDPQIQLAEDGARAIEGGALPLAVAGNGGIDPSQSLAPFVIVTDANGKVVASSAKLGAAAPVPLKGMLDAAKASGELRETWQPRVDARIASVIVPVSGGTKGYVLAGRSLRAVEDRIDTLMPMIAFGWAATMLATLAAAWFVLGIVEPKAARAVAQ
jgi:hypothetical protein